MSRLTSRAIVISSALVVSCFATAFGAERLLKVVHLEPWGGNHEGVQFDWPFANQMHHVVIHEPYAKQTIAVYTAEEVEARLKPIEDSVAKLTEAMDTKLGNLRLDLLAAIDKAHESQLKALAATVRQNLKDELRSEIKAELLQEIIAELKDKYELKVK